MKGNYFEQCADCIKLSGGLNQVLVSNNVGTANNTNFLSIFGGGYTMWVDATGDLRIKSGFATSDTDGTVVGTQS